MLVTVYDFDYLFNYIECNKKVIDVVLCGPGDNFKMEYEVVYRKEKGYLKDLTVLTPKICDKHFVCGGYLWAIIIYTNNSIDQIGVGQKKELSEEEICALNDEFLERYKNL